MTSDRSNSEFEKLLENDFCAFIHRSFLELNPQSKFQSNWHIELMAAKLDAVRRGEIRRLVLNLPPRNLKSHTGSIAFAAWVLGHAPSSKIYCASYSQPFADKLAHDCRKLMMSPFYRSLFKTRISEDRRAAADFETTAGGQRFATSVEGGGTGRGGDLIIVDDPLKADDAYSDAQRNRVNNWYESTLYTRLDSKENGAIVLIMQRLHADDLTAHVLKQETWEVLSFPAIATEPKEYPFSTIFGRRCVRRELDQALHPERESRETIAGLQRVMRDAKFQAQYQQDPLPPSGTYVKTEWFKPFSEPPTNPDRIVQSWDTASKVEEEHDFSVCTTWSIVGQHVYLIDVLRERLEFPDLLKEVKNQSAKHHPETILIENTVSGIGLIQQLRRDEISNITAVSPKGEKQQRYMAQSAKIQSGFVHVLQGADWHDRYVGELTAFPNSAYADQVDSTTNFLKWMSDCDEMPGMNLMRYYDDQLRGVESSDGPRLVRMRLKEASGSYNLRNGSHLPYDSNGNISVPEDEVWIFRNMGAVVLDE